MGWSNRATLANFGQNLSSGSSGAVVCAQAILARLCPYVGTQLYVRFAPCAIRLLQSPGAVSLFLCGYVLLQAVLTAPGGATNETVQPKNVVRVLARNGHQHCGDAATDVHPYSCEHLASCRSLAREEWRSSRMCGQSICQSENIVGERCAPRHSIGRLQSCGSMPCLSAVRPVQTIVSWIATPRDN